MIKTRKKMRKIAIKVAIFMIGIIGLFGYGVYTIVLHKGLFETKSIYFLKAPNAENFFEGMPVYYHGFAIGNIATIALDDDGLVKMEMEVSEKNRKWLHQDAKFMLIKPLIGTPKLQVISSLDVPLLAPEMVASVTIFDGIDELILKVEPLLKRTENILTNVDKLTTDMIDPQKPYQHILQNTQTLSERLTQNKALLEIVTGQSGSGKSFDGILKETEGLVQQLRKTLNSVDGTITKTDQTTLKLLNAILVDIQSKLKRIDGTITYVATSPQKVELLNEQLQLTLQKTNVLIEKVEIYLQSYKNEKVVLP